METITLNSIAAPNSSSLTDARSNDSILLAELSHGPQSRTDLAQKTGLPRSTVHACIRRLIANNEVEEFQLASSTGGRRAALIRISPLRDIADVVELGSHHARLGIVDLFGNVRATTNIPLNIADGPEATITTLYNGWAQLHKEHPTIPKRPSSAQQFLAPSTPKATLSPQPVCPAGTIPTSQPSWRTQLAAPSSLKMMPAQPQ